MRRSTFPLLAALAVVLTTSCMESTAPKTNLGSDPRKETFATSLGVNLAAMTEIPVPDVERSVWYQDLATTDTGTVVKLGDKLTIHYSLWLKDGTLIESSRSTGRTVDLTLFYGNGGVIRGWTIGIPGMKAGGKRRLVIPSILGYGGTPPTGSRIPPHSTLVFEVEVFKTVAPTTAQ